LGTWDLVKMGYNVFEAVWGYDWVRREGELVGAKKPKTGPPGLGFGQRNAGGLHIGYRRPGWGSVSADEGGGGGHWAATQGRAGLAHLIALPPFSFSNPFPTP
jgi:hypothetical protein